MQKKPKIILMNEPDQIWEAPMDEIKRRGYIIIPASKLGYSKLEKEYEAWAVENQLPIAKIIVRTKYVYFRIDVDHIANLEITEERMVRIGKYLDSLIKRGKELDTFPKKKGWFNTSGDLFLLGYILKGYERVYMPKVLAFIKKVLDIKDGRELNGQETGQ